MAIRLAASTLLIAALVSAANAAEQFTITDSGALRRAGKTIARLALDSQHKPFLLKSSQVRVASKTLTRVDVRDARGRVTTWIGQPASGKTIYAGPTGVQGIDGSSKIHVQALGASVLLRYRSNAAVQRCDGQPVYLDPHVYDWQQRRFRPVQPRLTPAKRTLPALTVKPLQFELAPKPLHGFRLSAASSTHGTRGGAAIVPVELFDGDPNTAWREGAFGDGRGQFVTATRLRARYPLWGLQLRLGQGTTAKQQRRVRRPARLQLQLDNGTTYAIALPKRYKPGQPLWVPLPKTGSKCVTLVLGPARPGPKTAPSAISELRLITTLESRRISPAQRTARLAKLLAADDAADRAFAARLLRRIGPGALKALQGHLDSASAPARRAMLRLATAMGGAEAIPLILAIAQHAPSEPELTQALRRVPGPLLLRTVRAHAPGTQGAFRVALLRALRDKPTPQTASVLVPLLGLGSDAERAALTACLAALPTPASQLLPANLSQAALADAIAALAQRPVLEAEIQRRVGQAWPKGSFEVRYRLLQLTSKHAPALLLRQLPKLLAGEDPALAQTALHLVAKPSLELTAIVAKALKHRDPGVRAEALSAARRLNLRAEAITASVASLIEHEPWPFVATQAIESSATDCQPSLIAPLARAMRSAYDHIGLAALHALRRCKPAGLKRAIALVAFDAKAQPRVRAQALLALDPAAAKRRAGELGKLYADARAAAMGEPRFLSLAVAAGTALTLTPGGTAAVVDALALDPLAAIRIGAAKALAKRCNDDAKLALARAAKQDANASVRRVAAAARKRCH